MAVGFSFRVDVRPYSGYANPSLPIAAWVGQGTAVGDATGGNLNMDFFFQNDDEALITELFNLEQVALDTTAGVNTPGILRLISMDNLAPNRPMFGQIWSFTMNTRLGDTAIDMTRGSVLPLWLGAPNREEGDSGIRFFFDNVDARIYGVTIQGYIWGPRSVLAEGGPQRPPNGLFGP